MIPKTVRDELRRLAGLATAGPRTLVPRECSWADLIEAGMPAAEAAKQDPGDHWLGWELEEGTGFDLPQRGDFKGPDAAFLMATDPQTIVALLDEIDRLEQA